MALESAFDALGRHVEPAVRPDHPCLGVVAEDELERALVAMRMEVEPAGGRKIDEPPDDLARRVVAVDVKLADASIGPARELGFDQRHGFRVAEPGRTIGIAAIGAHEWDDGELRRGRREKRARSLVGRAIRQDRPDAVAPQDVERRRDRIRRDGVGVVVEMGVED